MKRLHFIVYLYMLLAAMVMLACASTTPGQERRGDKPGVACNREVFASDSGSAVQLAVGDLLCITLETNPGTGYSWVVQEMDITLMTQSEITRESGPSEDNRGGDSSGRIGQAEEFTYHFEAIAPGQTIVRMAYERVWEKDAPPMAYYEITVDIVSAE